MDDEDDEMEQVTVKKTRTRAGGSRKIVGAIRKLVLNTNQKPIRTKNNNSNNFGKQRRKGDFSQLSYSFREGKGSKKSTTTKSIGGSGNDKNDEEIVIPFFTDAASKKRLMIMDQNEIRNEVFENYEGAFRENIWKELWRRLKDSKGIVGSIISSLLHWGANNKENGLFLDNSSNNRNETIEEERKRKRSVEIWKEEIISSNEMLSDMFLDNVLLLISRKSSSSKNSSSSRFLFEPVPAGSIKLLKFEKNNVSKELIEDDSDVLSVFNILNTTESINGWVAFPINYGLHWMLLMMKIYRGEGGDDDENETNYVQAILYDPLPYNRDKRMDRIENRLNELWPTISRLYKLPNKLIWKEFKPLDHQKDSNCCGIYVILFLYIWSRVVITTTTTTSSRSFSNEKLRDEPMFGAIEYFVENRIGHSVLDNFFRPLLRKILFKN